MIPAAAEPGAAPRDVAVLIPDGRERFALAAAFAPDRLAALVTTLWTPPGRAPWRWLLSDEAARRRWRDDLPPDAVRPFAAPELARLLLARLAPGERARAALLDARNVAFDRHARRALARLDPAPRVVVGHPSCWLATLRWCRARSIRTVVVLPLAHPATVRATGAAMAARHPAWAATWDLAARSPRLERRYEAELAEADLVVVPSDYVAESCRAAGLPADKLRRVPYGADAARFAAARAARAAAAPRPAPRPVRFLTVGYLSQRKGTGTLLEAFARLPRGAATLDLVGA